MRTTSRRFPIFAFLVLMLPLAGFVVAQDQAQEKTQSKDASPAGPTPEELEEQRSTTQGKVTIEGEAIAYTASRV